MRSRRWYCGALLLGLVAGCGDQGTDPGLSGGSAVGGSGSSAIHGRVVTMRFVPESTFVPVAGARISVYFVDTLPSDTTGTPPDSSMVPLMHSATRRLGGFMAMLDSFPPDSGPPPPPPPDTLPTDTIPPDTNPPPPPIGCGRAGELLGVVETNREGRFRLRRLQAGQYDLVVQADSAKGLGAGYACGVLVRPEQRVEVNIFVPPVGPPR